MRPRRLAEVARDVSSHKRARRGRRARRCAIGLLAAAGVLPTPAFAHPNLLQSSPGGGQVVRRSPPAIAASFTEDSVIKASSLKLTGSDGKPIPLGRLTRTPNGPGMRATVVKPLQPGVYEVHFVALGNDGHTVGGGWQFAVAEADGRPPPGAASLAATTPGSRGGQTNGSDGAVTVFLHWINLLSAALLWGGVLLATLARRRLGGSLPGPATTRWPAVLLGTLWLAVMSAAILAVEAGTTGAASGFKLAVLTGSPTGSFVLARLAVLLGALLLALALPRRLERTQEAVIAAAGAFALVSYALGGHVAALRHDRAIASVVHSVHLLAVGTWLGGLLALALLVAWTPAGESRTAVLRTVGRAFGPVAGVAVVAIGVTGVLDALREVHHWYFLRWSDYGRLVIAKTALFAIVLAVAGVTAWTIARRSQVARRTMIAEGALGVGVLVLAAAMSGLAAGRGQPLPAQEGNLIPGPAFGNTQIGRGLVELTVFPGRPGPNTVTAAIAPLEQIGERAPRPRAMTVRFTCDCSRRVVTARLRRSGSTWRARLDLPDEGVWLATPDFNRIASLQPVTLGIGVSPARGAPLVHIASIADMTGPDARDCRSSEIGLQLAVAGINLQGGADGGRKVVQDVYDDGGDPARARALALEAERRGATALVAPCGSAAAAAVEAVGKRLPTIVADPDIAAVDADRVFRLAGTPYGSGYAAGQYVAHNAFVAFRDAPRHAAAVVAPGPDGDAAAKALRAALAPSGVDVTVFRLDRESTTSEIMQAIDASRYVATYFDGPERRVSGLLSAIGERNPTLPTMALLVSPHLYTERFMLDAGQFGRLGVLRAIGDVSPVSRDATTYLGLVQSVYRGEHPTIPGLRSYLAGTALAKVLGGSLQAGDLAGSLRKLGRFSDALAIGWQAKDPWQGSKLYGVFQSNFLAQNLTPNQDQGAAPASSTTATGPWPAATCSARSRSSSARRRRSSCRRSDANAACTVPCPPSRRTVHGAVTEPCGSCGSSARGTQRCVTRRALPRRRARPWHLDRPFDLGAVRERLRLQPAVRPGKADGQARVEGDLRDGPACAARRCAQGHALGSARQAVRDRQAVRAAARQRTLRRIPVEL